MRYIYSHHRGEIASSIWHLWHQQHEDACSRRLRSVTHGLLEFDPDILFGGVQMIHESVREFFFSSDGLELLGLEVGDDPNEVAVTELGNASIAFLNGYRNYFETQTGFEAGSESDLLKTYIAWRNLGVRRTGFAGDVLSSIAYVSHVLAAGSRHFNNSPTAALTGNVDEGTILAGLALGVLHERDLEMLRALTVGDGLQSQALLRCLQLQYCCEVALWRAMESVNITVLFTGLDDNPNLTRCEIVMSMFRAATRQTDEDEPSSHVQPCEQMVLKCEAMLLESPPTPEEMKEFVHQFGHGATHLVDNGRKRHWVEIQRFSSYADQEQWCTDPPPKVMYVSEYEDKVDPYDLMLVQVYECSEPRDGCCAQKWNGDSIYYHKSLLGQRWARPDKTEEYHYGHHWRFDPVSEQESAEGHNASPSN